MSARRSPDCVVVPVQQRNFAGECKWPVQSVLSVRVVNLVLEQVGRWHDAEVRDLERRVSPLRPHDLRHTFAFRLAAEMGADAYELERWLGHRSQRYIQLRTNLLEDAAAGCVEGF